MSKEAGIGDIQTSNIPSPRIPLDLIDNQENQEEERADEIPRAMTIEVNRETNSLKI